LAADAWSKDGQQGAYYRVMRDVDVSEDANQEKLIAVLDVFDGWRR